MSSFDINITISCPSCGASPTTLELPDDFTDDDTAHCKGCGFGLGTYGAIRKAGMKVAKDEVVRSLKQSLKGMKGFKVK